MLKTMDHSLTNAEINTAPSIAVQKRESKRLLIKAFRQTRRIKSLIDSRFAWILSPTQKACSFISTWLNGKNDWVNVLKDQAKIRSQQDLESLDVLYPQTQEKLIQTKAPSAYKSHKDLPNLFETVPVRVISWTLQRDEVKSQQLDKATQLHLGPYPKSTPVAIEASPKPQAKLKETDLQYAQYDDVLARHNAMVNGSINDLVNRYFSHAID